MEKFLDTLKTIVKILLHPDQKKKPDQKDVENLIEMLLEGCRESLKLRQGLGAKIQKDIFEVLTSMLYYYQERITETFLDKILELFLILDVENCELKI